MFTWARYTNNLFVFAAIFVSITLYITILRACSRNIVSITCINLPVEILMYHNLGEIKLVPYVSISATLRFIYHL